MFKRTLNYLAWSFILVFAVYYVLNNAFRYFDFSSAAYRIDLKPFQLSLFIHIVGGILALLLGPLQFSDRLRKKLPRVHRTVGKVYLIAILISAPLAIYLGIAHVLLASKDYVGGVGISSMGFAWLCTAAMAYVAIRNRNFVQHKEWMIRNYVITFGFVTIRLIIELTMKNFTIEFLQIRAIATWASWAFPLLITEFILQYPKLKMPGKKTAAASMR
jgi:uncharacterized membrane protein